MNRAHGNLKLPLGQLPGDGYRVTKCVHFGLGNRPLVFEQ